MQSIKQFLYLAKALALTVCAAFLMASLPAAAQQPATTGYVLGASDIVQVIIYGQPEAGVTTRVKADGTIVMPFIGSVNVDGQTSVSLAKLIAEKMVAGGYLRDPQVNVEITQYVSKSVNVAGRVSAPGIVPLDQPYRALEVLLKTGWIRDEGATYIYLRRPGQPERQLLVEGVVRGDDESNPVMAPGDTLYVPDSDKFYVYGAINNTGAYPILPGMTVRQALTLAGGVSSNGSLNKVGLLRGNAKEVDADLSQTLQKNDVLVVKERLF